VEVSSECVGSVETEHLRLGACLTTQRHSSILLSGPSMNTHTHTMARTQNTGHTNHKQKYMHKMYMCLPPSSTSHTHVGHTQAPRIPHCQLVYMRSFPFYLSLPLLLLLPYTPLIPLLTRASHIASHLMHGIFPSGLLPYITYPLAVSHPSRFPSRNLSS
jgi:hypothetical protein